jgi:Zn-dependent M28 family amino/carboxypeptidase
MTIRTLISFAVLFIFSGLLQAEEAKRVVADKERIVKTVRFLSEEIHFRSAFPENKEKTIDYLIKAISAAELEATRGEFAIKQILGDDDHNNNAMEAIELSRQTYANIHALKKGKTDKRIVVGAHYDTVRISPGADDNASAVAALVELAYLLKGIAELNCDVELVFYDLEEDGLFGSRYHAKKLKNQKIDVVCMLCMDMVGYYSDKENSQDYPVGGMNLLYGTKGDFLAMIGRPEDTKLIAETTKTFREATTLKILSLPAPKGLDVLFMRSDHAPFWWEGYPALFFTDTADFRKKNYSKRGDTWDTLDYDRLAQVPVGLYHIILAIDAAHPPK